jgi:hypothetical protein
MARAGGPDAVVRLASAIEMEMVVTSRAVI